MSIAIETRIAIGDLLEDPKYKALSTESMRNRRRVFYFAFLVVYNIIFLSYAGNKEQLGLYKGFGKYYS
jgi:hypothetical protein